MPQVFEGRYNEAAQDVRSILKKEDWDDGHLGPVLLRLAWHASGTYDRQTKSGGSNGATMRFAPESTDGANAGLEHARAFLESVKRKHEWISYADLWTLAGVIAVEEMGGPQIAWRPGRKDEPAGTDKVPPNGRLPDAKQGASHLRDVFYRMGFNDQEIVALSGAHALGRCHTDRSGYDGPWTYTPTRLTNQYYKLLLNVEWKKKEWDGPLQYVDPRDRIMMLPTDMVLREDEKFRPYVELYAKDKTKFFTDFAAAFGKLIELGWKEDAGTADRPRL